MGYVAVRGGERAILQAEAFFRWLNGKPGMEFLRQLEVHLPYLLDRVMGEGSLYAPELAAQAIAQTGGDLYEAVLLLRAYRTTQPRLAYAEPLTPEAMLTVRRISAAFKDIPGGQVLGPSLDYSHRVLQPEEPPKAPAGPPAALHFPRVADWHRLTGLLPIAPPDPTPPSAIPDLTREPLLFPAPRAHRLQALSRADSGGVLALGYADMRGYSGAGGTHPTVNEVRLAYAEVRLRHPTTGAVFSAGRVRYSQAEVVTKFKEVNGKPGLELGFAATLGWNEVKLIAAAMLDAAMNRPDGHPAHQEEFVLMHTEPVEASGFCIHYKLPHYVTFGSDLDALRRARSEEAVE